MPIIAPVMKRMPFCRNSGDDAVTISSHRIPSIGLCAASTPPRSDPEQGKVLATSDTDPHIDLRGVIVLRKGRIVAGRSCNDETAETSRPLLRSSTATCQSRAAWKTRAFKSISAARTIHFDEQVRRFCFSVKTTERRSAFGDALNKHL